MRGFQPKTVHPVASRYTYYAILTHSLYGNNVIKLIVTILSVTTLAVDKHLYLVRSPYIIFPWKEVMFWKRFSWLYYFLRILGNNQLDAIFRVFIYFMSLHVSSVTAFIIRRSNCINTSSGRLVCVSDCLLCRSGGNSGVPS